MYSKKQKEFKESVLKGESIFLTGKAGTGKTFIVKETIKELKELGKNVAIVAPTGIAANNAGGATIHSTFSLPVNGLIEYKNCSFLKDNKRSVCKKIDVLFIDEISMVRADMFDGINWTLIKNGCKNLSEMQIVIIGDMKQLEPVATDNFKSILFKRYDGLSFIHSDCFKSLSIKTIELDEVLRQSDNEFINALNNIREGNKDEYFKRFVSDKHKGIVLAPHNSTVNKYNEEGLNSLKSETINFKAVMTGKITEYDTNFVPDLNLKHGCKVMYLVNSKDNKLFNGSIGTFIVKNGKYFIEVNQVKHPVEIVKQTKSEYILNEKNNKLELKEIGSIEQIPLKLAYAISIHKSQGLTFKEGTLDLTKPCFSKGQMYVGLSRFSNPEGISILIP